MTQSVFAAIFVMSLLVAGVLSLSTPIEQKQSVMDSLLLWSEAVDRHIGSFAGRCNPGPSSQTDLTLSSLDQGFKAFGLVWTYNASSGLTSLSPDSTRPQHFSISAKRAQALISRLAESQWLAGNTALAFDHRSVGLKTISSDPLYLSILMYHKQQGGNCL